MYEPTDESFNMALRYKKIRKRLDNLGYRHILSLDALPLVEQLLADLIQTTESLKHFKSVAENNIETAAPSVLTVDPFKCDHTKLVEECNQLHAELLETKENHLKQTKDLKRKIKILETDCSDLQLASSRNLKRIKDLELESSNKSKRIQELLGKCLKPTISNSSLASKKRSVYPLRRPVLEGDSKLPENVNDSPRYPNLTKVDPHIFDIVGMAERRAKSLNEEAMKLKDQLSIQTDNVSTLKAQVTMKDREISRLRRLLESGRSYNSVSADCSCRKNKQNCSQCTGNHSVCNKMSDISEIRILQQAKLNLEQQLRDALDKQHDAMTQAMKLAERNEELEKELRDIDHIALAVEADCNSTVKENNKHVTQLQDKLEKNRALIHELENNLLVEKRTSQELRADLEACKLEKRNLQRSLDNSLDEKKQLTDRINELTIIEKDLNDEIDKLSSINGAQKHELVELKGAHELLKKQLHGDASVTRHNKKTIAQLSKDKSLVSKTKKAGSVAVDAGSRKSMENAQNKVRDLQKTIEQLECDCEHYKKEWSKLNEQRVKSSTFENTELWDQICDLKRQLSEKEHRICELQREKRELSREKFDLEARQSSRTHGRSPCNTCNNYRSTEACVCLPTNSATESGSSKLVISRLERERDTARAELARVTEERDILRERLKLATEAHTSEQRRLRERLRVVEKRLEELDREKQDILHAQGTQRSTVSELENHMEDLREELRRTKQELTSQRTQYFQLRTLQDQTDQALGNVQSQLNQSETELSRTMERNRSLEQLQVQLDNQMKEFKQEINTLRSNMARLDREKDQLLMELDEKTEKIAVLEREVLIKDQQTTGVDQQLRDFQHKNQLYVDQCAEQERKLRNMQMELQNIQRQLCGANADRDNACQENCRLQDDLAAVSCEYKNLQRELEKSRAESCDLKTQLQTYVSEVRRVEDLLHRKENERTEMLNHFRSLSLEATVLENNNHSLESEATEARNGLQAAKDRLVDLERQLAVKDSLIKGYEGQITELTQSVAALESQLHQQILERERAETDVNLLRDMCVQIDQKKESLLQELSDKEAVKAQVESQLSRLKADQNLLHDQTSRDRAAVARLQSMLDQSRREAMESQKTSQELQNEIARLKTRISELQSQLSAESAELRRYQNQAADFDKQISDLRRQVTDERFKRSQKEEQHRRHVQIAGDSGLHFENLPGEPGVPHLSLEPSSTRHELMPGSFRYQSPTKIPGDEAGKSTMTLPDNPRKIYKTTAKESSSYKDTRGDTDRDKDRVEPSPEVVKCTCGPLCIQASIQEDDRNKDITLHITDAVLQHVKTPDATKTNAVSNKSKDSNVNPGEKNDNTSTVTAEKAVKNSLRPVEPPGERVVQVRRGVDSSSDEISQQGPRITVVQADVHRADESGLLLPENTVPNIEEEVQTVAPSGLEDREACGCRGNKYLANCRAGGERPKIVITLDDDPPSSNARKRDKTPPNFPISQSKASPKAPARVPTAGEMDRIEEMPEIVIESVETLQSAIEADKLLETAVLREKMSPQEFIKYIAGFGPFCQDMEMQLSKMNDMMLADMHASSERTRDFDAKNNENAASEVSSGLRPRGGPREAQGSRTTMSPRSDTGREMHAGKKYKDSKHKQSTASSDGDIDGCNLRKCKHCGNYKPVKTPRAVANPAMQSDMPVDEGTVFPERPQPRQESDKRVVRTSTGTSKNSRDGRKRKNSRGGGSDTADHQGGSTLPSSSSGEYIGTCTDTDCG